jgi:hypothetical protein
MVFGLRRTTYPFSRVLLMEICEDRHKTEISLEAQAVPRAQVHYNDLIALLHPLLNQLFNTSKEMRVQERKEEEINMKDSRIGGWAE